jgi:pimeloyl-ACP methyl ester carboxylesterase
MSGLFAEVFGAGPAVVLLHGQPGGRGDWAAVASRLEADYLVVAPDRPGYGQTGGRARGFRGNAAAVVSLLDRLGVDRATIVGYSWAGGAALALAAEVPHRVAGLVLVSSVAPGEPLGWLDRTLAVPSIGIGVTAAGLFVASRALALPPVRRALARRHGPCRPDSDEATDGDCDADGTGPDRGRGYRGPDPTTVLPSWRSARVGQSFVTEQRSLIDELPLLATGLAGITAPTVVVQGDADRTVAPTAGRRLAEVIPGARLVALAGVGHLVIHQRPEAVAAAVHQVTPR